MLSYSLPSEVYTTCPNRTQTQLGLCHHNTYSSAN